MKYTPTKILIWGKTYPELSRRYRETVCTGGVLEDGSPVRLYPVPLRYLDRDEQYQKYDWIELAIARNPQDARPESYRVKTDHMKFLGHLEPGGEGWPSRKDFMFRNADWQFPNVDALKSAHEASGRSLGIIRPGQIDEVRMEEKPAAEASEFAKRLEEILSQGELFGSKPKELQYLRFHLKLLWRCAEPCSVCRRAPHDMKVLDWEALELARRLGFQVAKTRLEEITNLETMDFHLFMGNFAQHPSAFGIVGLWYPMKSSTPVPRRLI